MQLSCIIITIMYRLKEILDGLKDRKIKITQGRKKIISLLLQQNTPITVKKILELIHKDNLHLNKTTVYRQLEFLASKNIIKILNFGDGERRFEIKGKHHHHIVCKRCKRVEAVSSDLLEDKLFFLEQEIFHRGLYRNISHSLEFYGLCKNCKI